MNQSSMEVAHDFHPFFRVYEDGHTERFLGAPFILPSTDPTTGVQSKDVIISPDPKVSARLYLPKSATDHHHHHKFPLLIYIHGGAFSIESAFSTFYHNYLNSLVSAANFVAVSIEYRLAPEHPIPACYEDSWVVLKWVTLHGKPNQGPDPWINQYADLNRVFLAGDSAGANICHNIAVRSGIEGLGSGVNIVGMVLVHPFFGNGKPDNLWDFICPDSSGCNDPRLNPAADLSLLGKIGCGKVLVCTASKDFLRKRGWFYFQTLKSSDWKGIIEILESENEEHVFHLFNPTCKKAESLMNSIASFINQKWTTHSLL